MIRAVFVAGLLGLAAVPASGQILGDEDVEHLAGCYVVELGEWRDGDRAVDPEEVPAIPETLDLSMKRSFPNQISTPPHSPVVRLAVVLDADGRRIPGLQTWRAPNPRQFSLGGIAPDGSSLSGLSVRLDENGELVGWFYFVPPGTEIGPAGPGTPSGRLLKLRPSSCPEGPARG